MPKFEQISIEQVPEEELQEQAKEILDNLKDLIEAEKQEQAQELLENQIEQGGEDVQEVKKEIAEYVIDNPEVIDESRDTVGSIIGFINKTLGSKAAGKAAKIALAMGILYGAKEAVSIPEAEAKHAEEKKVEEEPSEESLWDTVSKILNKKEKNKKDWDDLLDVLDKIEHPKEGKITAYSQLLRGVANLGLARLKMEEKNEENPLKPKMEARKIFTKAEKALEYAEDNRAGFEKNSMQIHYHRYYRAITTYENYKLAGYLREDDADNLKEDAKARLASFIRYINKALKNNKVPEEEVEQFTNLKDEALDIYKSIPR